MCDRNVFESLIYVHVFYQNIFQNDAGGGDYSNQILLDGANGVGALKVMQFLNHLETSLLNITVCNDGSNGKLNEMVRWNDAKLMKRLQYYICEFDCTSDNEYRYKATIYY